jgi:hypothetical protein
MEQSSSRIYSVSHTALYLQSKCQEVEPISINDICHFLLRGLHLSQKEIVLLET